MEPVGALLLTSRDNVSTSLRDIEPGAEVWVRSGDEVLRVKALERIPFGFKMAMVRIARGAPVVKYGEPIGLASGDIDPGMLVHIHNIEGARGRGDLEHGVTT